MRMYDLNPYPLASGRWALTITQITHDRFGVSELPFYSLPEFESEAEALSYGEFIATKGGIGLAPRNQPPSRGLGLFSRLLKMEL
jgi:hypothetical protein